MKLISYPFRVTNDGTVATTDDGMDYYAEELAMLIKTNPGERGLVPDYGIDDPTFNTIGTVELLEKVNTFGPPVEITDVETFYPSEGRLDINVIYDARPEEETEIQYSSDYYDEEDFSDEDQTADDYENDLE